MLFDTDPDVHPALVRPVLSQPGNEQLWQMSRQKDIGAFQECTRRRGFDRLGVARDSPRRAGASDDLLAKRRPLHGATARRRGTSPRLAVQTRL